VAKWLCRSRHLNFNLCIPIIVVRDRATHGFLITAMLFAMAEWDRSLSVANSESVLALSWGLRQRVEPV
jgi:hypothetical protein